MKRKLCLSVALLALPFAVALGGGAHFTLGIPGAPVICTNSTQNAWLASNNVYAVMSVVSPGSTNAVSQSTNAGHDPVKLAAVEAGFVLERTRPEYFLGDRVAPPDGVDWPATYDKFRADVAAGRVPGTAFLFDPSGEAVYVAAGGTLPFTWVLANGQTRAVSYTVATACTGRPRRIYWTDHPYNAPGIDLSGKFVKFFGAPEILTPQYGTVTNIVDGNELEDTHHIVSGLVLDTSTHVLMAHGNLSGQVVMAYYDSGTYENLLLVQVVEVGCPQVNVLPGEIGRALKPDGRGYNTDGLRARPVMMDQEPSDDRGPFLYQHKGQYSYSPKNGNVYPLRRTVDSESGDNKRSNAAVYWMETDEMGVQWPFELDHYVCDWPKDTTVFVRGDVGGDGGRPIYIPSDYAPTLMKFQEPEGHAFAPTADGTFTSTNNGYALLRLTTEDNIWFVPIHSVLRSDTNYFTLAAADVSVGSELRLRDGADAGTAEGFSPVCDATSPGTIYEATSARIWHPGLYVPAKPAAQESSSVDPTTVVESGGDTNAYESVIFPVTAIADDPKIEVWWNSTIQVEDMPSPITIPTLPQVYSVNWPKKWETPSIVIASQLGSVGESIFAHNKALSLDENSSAATLASRAYFSSEGGMLTFWLKVGPNFDGAGNRSVLSIRRSGRLKLTFDLFRDGDTTKLAFWYGGTLTPIPLPADALSDESGSWFPVAISIFPDWAKVFVGQGGAENTVNGNMRQLLGATIEAAIGAANPGWEARTGVAVGEVCFWPVPHDSFTDIFPMVIRPQVAGVNGISGLYAFGGDDLADKPDQRREFTEGVLGVSCFADNCSRVEKGPPLLGAAVIDADAGFTPRVYVQNDSAADGYNPNEEHAIVRAGSGGYVAWALRSDLNTADSSVPGVLVEYVKDGRKAMKWFNVALTNSVYPELAADCVAGKALPGPHPLDLFDDPWRDETYWDEPLSVAPVHRDRKKQLWAKAAGSLTVHMYYPMQEGFAFPSVPAASWPKIGKSIPWLSLLANPTGDAIASQPAPWLWRVAWPENVPEIEIGRTLSVAASGLPEVWNAKSVGILWPPTDAERKKTAVLFDPTVAQSSGFSTKTYATVADAVAGLGIKQGQGGNATLRKGKWTFDGLPPSISSRFYLDTTAHVTNCLKLVGQMEDNPGGVSLLHVNVLNQDERDALANLINDNAWRQAIAGLAKTCVQPSPHEQKSSKEDRIDYRPRDHYALFTMGATNYVTIIENDATDERMNVAAGDPIQMHVIKVVPRYYVGRVVTREDPYNLLSQQLSVIYAEAFAGSPEDYVFEWKKCAPRPDGVVPTDFAGEYTAKFEPTAGKTRFVIGEQGDTLANMVNTYYVMRYRAANENSPAYAAMGDAWSAWTDPPVLAEGWVQRVLNNVTPFTQRMRDLVDNEAETAVTMIRQAGAPYEGDVALNQDNLTEVGLIQLYETLLSKAESMSLQLGINDAGANKQLQLAVGRLGDLYNLLGDEAYTDALNPTISFGPGSGLGSSVDYGALSSALFCFDNQVPSLLDEELALFRGRTQENAPSTHLSPYYNRLVWNFTRGMNAGEVAYAVNYDISGNNKGVIDYSQAAEMYPQGHGDAYGHYLSALSGYYRLMRNPYFTWGKPAMGEMVVADAVVNVDYYDEAQFAKTAYNVAKTALEVVDRTARKAYRDNGGASGAGYIDSNASRNFGYGEWASRGGFGALCNWAVGNTLLDEEPHAKDYRRFAFTDVEDRICPNSEDPGRLSGDAVPELPLNGTWTAEFQVVLGENPAPDGVANLFTIKGEYTALSVSIESNNVLSASYGSLQKWGGHWEYTAEYETANADEFYSANPDDDLPESYITMEGTNALGERVVAELRFHGLNPPTSFPDGFDAADAEGWTQDLNIPQLDGWNLLWVYPFYFSELVYEIDPNNTETVACGAIPVGESVLVSIRSSGGRPVVTAFSASGAKILEEQLPFDVDINRAEMLGLGGGFIGEIGEFRFWNGVSRPDGELLASREYASPLSEGLVLYMRPISKQGGVSKVMDAKYDWLEWNFVGGEWLEPAASTIDIAFTDEGLKRIDRSTVPELASLAGVASQIQKKVDQMDAGLNPLGLSSGAIPFDITPIGMEDGTATHYEQIRGRAVTALSNARAALNKAQESANRMRMLQDAAVDKDASLESEELAFKNRMIEYFGYPYAGDIGPAGTYPQGYDGPDIYHYAWMDPADFGLSVISNTFTVSMKVKKDPWDGSSNLFAPANPVNEDEEKEIELTFELSANGMVLKPKSITGKRLAQGKIQDALASFFVAYAEFENAIKEYGNSYDDFETAIAHTRAVTGMLAVKETLELSLITAGSFIAIKKAALNVCVNTLESIKEITGDVRDAVIGAAPKIMGAGMTVNTDPSAIVHGIANTTALPGIEAFETGMVNAKNALVGLEALEAFMQVPKDTMAVIEEITNGQMEEAEKLGEAVSALDKAINAVCSAYRSLQIAQAAVETAIAEAQRIIDERTLMRQQAVDSFTQARYGEMFFRIQRDNALSRYSTMFDLAQKYTYLAAQAYDFETGLLSSDSASGENFIARIVGARTLGEFDGDGNPMFATGAAGGDGGLADILAEMNANWLVLKPRLGINNSQPYATWFSLRHDLFRIFDGEAGDKKWKTELRKYVVDDLNAVPEFRHYCQPLAGSSMTKEPGFVIPFSSAIAHGYNFFGQPLTSGDSSLDPTYYATHISSAGVHFENYDKKVFANTPVAYLVPIGEDRMRAVGDPDTVLSWKVVDQTIPAPFAIGSTKLDDPDWAPLYNGNTGGNDVGARIRKHPSFRAYYGGKGDEPGNDSLDCTRLIGRSAWNTKWLLIIPAGSMNSDREAALAAFIGGVDQNRDGKLEYEGVSDIKIGLKTYSASGN